MAQLFLKIKDTKIITDNNYAFLAQNSNNYDTIKFEFDEEWDDFSKTVILHQKENETVKINLENNICLIPSTVLRYALPLYVSVHGISLNGTDEKDTEHMSFNVMRGII